MDGCTDRRTDGRTDRLKDIHADGKSIALGICKLCVSIRHSGTGTNKKQRDENIDEKVDAVRKTDSQTDRQTDKQTDRPIERKTTSRL